MATSIKVNQDCEIVFDEYGLCEIVDEKEDIAQAIRVELEQNKGQYSLNVLFGTPYLNEQNTGLLQVKNNNEKILLEIRKVISKYKEVEILELNFNSNNRLMARLLIKGDEVEL